MDSLKACVVIALDPSGNMVLPDSAFSFLDEEELLAAVAAVQDGDDDGLLSSLGLRYLTREQGDQTLIAFTDRSNELVALRNLSLASLIVGVCSLAAFFGISLFLASLALRPVEKAWQQQQQFVADASHELKTPLTVILANLSILKAHPQDTIAAQGKWLDSTKEEAVRMKKLVDELLYLARADAGHPTGTLTQINISDTVWSAVLPFESVAFERGLTLDSQIEPQLTMQADESLLKQLTAILLDNACKYSVPGGIVRVLLVREQSRLTLRVCNQGPVIPLRDRERLFERFYRSDESRARQAGGYGLGLAIAKSITEFHGGNICVERSDEEMTVFCVSFPL